MGKMEEIVVVFDFDRTIIDVDSDNWVMNELGFTELFNRLLPTTPWNPLMDQIMKEMHEKGVMIDNIVEVLKRTPIHPRIIPALYSTYLKGCEMIIVSDANRFHIDTILDHHGIKNYFKEIHTNPGHVDSQGRLRILPHHDFTVSSHGCTVNHCPPNMCKGMVMERLLSNAKNKKFIYLGDGIGDYCPSLKLSKGDHLMPRKGFPIWDLISENPSRIAAEVHPWTDGTELESVLLSLIDTVSTDDDQENDKGGVNTQLIATECKFETVPLSAYDVMPPALSVPQ